MQKPFLSASLFALVRTEFFLIPVLIEHNNRAAFNLNKRNLVDHSVGVEEEIWHMYFIERNLVDHRVGVEEEIWYMYFIEKLPLTRY